MTQVIGNIIFILLLVFANAFFVAAEFAIVKVRSTQIAQRVKRGHRYAPLAKHIVEHLDAYLSATQLGITLASLGLGWIGEPVLAEMLRQPLTTLGMTSEKVLHGVSFGIAFSMLTFLHIVLGELAPKSLAIQYPETTTFIVSFPLQLFYNIFKPAIWALNSAANFLLRIAGISPASPAELVHSADELEMLVTEGAKRGVLTKTEEELISSIFEFSDTSAREIMVPRTEVVAIEDTTDREKLIRIVIEEGYSRIPVYHETIDNIIGIIYTKDLISLLEHRDLIILHDIIRPALFVPEQIKISKLMRDLQQQKIHMAIVVDEFGGTQGIVTMEDILEEIVGEIHDEYDEVVKEVEQATDGSAVVDAKIDIQNFNERFNCEIPESAEYETLSGFLAKLTGKIPDVKEVIVYQNLQFTVLKKTQRQVREVKVRKTDHSSP
jgi:CBS domain containing-hemolysin-like protein